MSQELLLIPGRASHASSGWVEGLTYDLDGAARWIYKACMESRNDTLIMNRPGGVREPEQLHTQGPSGSVRFEDVALTGRAETSLLASTEEVQQWSQIELDTCNETSRVARAISAEAKKNGGLLTCSHAGTSRAVSGPSFFFFFFTSSALCHCTYSRVCSLL